MRALVELCLAGTVMAALFADLIRRWRHRSGVVSIGDMKGALPFPAIAVLGGVSSVYCGWLGWALLIVAALASGESVKIEASSTPQLEKAILLRSLLLSEVAVLAFSIRAVLTNTAALTLLAGG